MQSDDAVQLLLFEGEIKKSLKSLIHIESLIATAKKKVKVKSREARRIRSENQLPTWWTFTEVKWENNEKEKFNSSGQNKWQN